MSNPTPVPAHTAPSGKVTKWGVSIHLALPGEAPEGPTFKTRKEAQAWCDAYEAPAPAGTPGLTADQDARVDAMLSKAEVALALTETGVAQIAAITGETPEQVVEAAAAQGIAAPAPAAAIEAADLLPPDAVTDSPKSGQYTRVKVNGKPVGYVSPRKAGALLVEVLSSRLTDAPRELLEGTKVRQNQTALLVTDEATAEQARGLFAHAASRVQA